MIRKTIKTLDEMPDTEMFQPGMLPADIQKLWNGNAKTEQERRRARMFGDLASLSKRFVNEGVAFESLLSEPGMKNVSAAIYALEWSVLYYAAETKRQRRTARGYWKCIWDALLDRR